MPRNSKIIFPILAATSWRGYITKLKRGLGIGIMRIRKKIENANTLPYSLPNIKSIPPYIKNTMESDEINKEPPDSSTIVKTAKLTAINITPRGDDFILSPLNCFLF